MISPACQIRVGCLGRLLDGEQEHQPLMPKHKSTSSVPWRDNPGPVRPPFPGRAGPMGLAGALHTVLGGGWELWAPQTPA